MAQEYGAASRMARVKDFQLSPLESPTAQPDTKMAKALKSARQIDATQRMQPRAWTPATPGPTVAAPNLGSSPGAAPLAVGPPAPPRPINAPPLGFSTGPVRNNLINFNTTPDPVPVNATTSLGAAPGRAVIPVDAGRALSAPFAAPAPGSTALVPAGQPRGFTAPYGASFDPKTIYQPTNASPGRALATIGEESRALVSAGPGQFVTPNNATPGRGLALTADAGRTTNSINIPSGYTPPKVNPTTGAYAAQGPAAPLPMTQPGIGRELAKGVAKGVGLGVAGYGAARLMNNIGQDDTPGKNIETRASVNSIPTGGNAPAPVAQPYSWWNDTDTGRNVSNTLNALAPVGGPAVGALRAGSGAARLAATGQAVAGGMAIGANGFKSQAEVQPESVPQPAKPATPNFQDPRILGNPGTIAEQAAAMGRPSAPTPEAADPNKIKVDRQTNGVMSFSGGPNIGQDGGQVSYDAGTTGFKPSGFGVSTLGGVIAPSAESQRVLTNPDGSRWTANDNAIMAANMRDGVDSYRGTSRAAGENANALKSRMTQLAMSSAGTPGRRGAMRAIASMQGEETARRGQDVTAAGQMANTNIAQYRAGLDGQELDMKRTTAGFGNRAAARIEALQAAYDKAPAADRAGIAEQLRVMTGKDRPDANRFTVVPGGQEWDATANAAITRPAQVINNQTGEFVQQGASARPATTPPAQAIAMLKSNPKMAADFDAKYGAGAAAQVMGQK